MKRVYKDSGIVYVHRESGFSISMKELKTYLLNSDDCEIGFSKMAGRDIKNIKSYKYSVKGIPFNKDFYMITKEDEFQYESICERCGYINLSDNGVFQCSKCDYVFVRRGF